jgi:hypothetical protein
MQLLEQDQGSFGWMMLSALEMNHHSSTVPDDHGETITVGMQKMQGSFVMVRYTYILPYVLDYMHIYGYCKKYLNSDKF